MNSEMKTFVFMHNVSGEKISIEAWAEKDAWNRLSLLHPIKEYDLL